MVTKNAGAEDALTHDIFRNRAHLNLLLDRLDEAKADAMAALTKMEDQRHKYLDSKAYFRAGCAAYKLGEFEVAKSFFGAQHRLSPGDKDAALNLQRTECRLREQTTGVYDFEKINARLSLGRPRTDAASFTQKTEIKASLRHGRGLYAATDMNPGDIVLCEKAFCVVWGHEHEAWTAMTYDVRDDVIRGFPASLSIAIVQKLLNNPSQIEKVMDLFGDYAGVGKELVMVDGASVIDIFQIQDIVARNAFGPGPVYDGHTTLDEDISNASAGLWIWAAHVNHSCLPNAKKEVIGDLLVLRAIQHISAGEEITLSYVESSEYGARATTLMNIWGFRCRCALCVRGR